MDTPPREVSFIQLAAFQRAWKRLGLTDDDQIELEELIRNAPDACPVVVGTGGLRKLRFAPPSWSRGKSGALRVGFAFIQVAGLVYLISVFRKSEKENFSDADKATIRSIIAALEAEHSK